MEEHADPGKERDATRKVDVYFSADVETDGPIPGPYSMLSFALVYAGRFEGTRYERPKEFAPTFYRELRPISEEFLPEAIAVTGLDRERLRREGTAPEAAMTEAAQWIVEVAGDGKPVLAAYPLGFDGAWLYWYFTKFSKSGCPFGYSLYLDIKTAFAVKAKRPIALAGRSKVPQFLQSTHAHTHHAVDDAIEQAEILANILEWDGKSSS